MTNKPTNIAYTAIDLRGDKTFWHRVGSAWQSDKTINIKLNSFPVNGEINLFVANEKVEGDSQH
jgi:hypothetical protein